MLRKEKEITTRGHLDGIIRQCRVCRLAMAVDGKPYVVPLSFGYDGQYLYFHTAKTGRKIEYLHANPNVCFEFEHDLRLISKTPQPCAWGFGFETIIGFGRMAELSAVEEKVQGLSHIIAHYNGDAAAIDSGELGRIRVWRLTIETMTGKKSPV